METTSLDNILDEKSAPPQKAAEEPAKPEPEPVKPEPEPVKAEPAKPEPPKHQDEFTAKERALLAAAQDERRKRQDLERRLAEKEAEFAKIPKEPPKQFWDDPDGAINQLEQKFEQRWAQKEAQIEGVAVNTRLNTAEAIARSKYTDFDEKIAVFSDILQANPGLQQEWVNSYDPAEYAYRLGKNRIELQQAGNMGALREKIEKETRIKIEAELKAKDEKLKADRDALPGSLSNIKGGTQNKVEWTGPTALSDILGGR